MMTFTEFAPQKFIYQQIIKLRKKLSQQCQNEPENGCGDNGLLFANTLRELFVNTAINNEDLLSGNNKDILR